MPKNPIPYPLRDILCLKSNAIAYTLPMLYPILIECRNNNLSYYVAVLRQYIGEPISHLNTMTNLLSKLYPMLIQKEKPNFSPKPNSCRQPIRIEHEKTLKPRQPIIIEYHSAERKPNALGWGGRPYTALSFSRLAIAYLIIWRVYHPPPPLDQLTLLLLSGCSKEIWRHRKEITWQNFQKLSVAVFEKNKV